MNGCIFEPALLLRKTLPSALLSELLRQAGHSKYSSPMDCVCYDKPGLIGRSPGPLTSRACIPLVITSSIAFVALPATPDTGA